MSFDKTVKKPYIPFKSFSTKIAKEFQIKITELLPVALDINDGLQNPQVLALVLEKENSLVFVVDYKTVYQVWKIRHDDLWKVESDEESTKIIITLRPECSMSQRKLALGESTNATETRVQGLIQLHLYPLMDQRTEGFYKRIVSYLFK